MTSAGVVVLVLVGAAAVWILSAAIIKIGRDEKIAGMVIDAPQSTSTTSDTQPSSLSQSLSSPNSIITDASLPDIEPGKPD